MRYVKPLVFAAMLAPLVWLVARAFTGGLGANPIDRITDETGTMALRSIVLTLAVTPFRRVTGWNEVIRLRRMLGLFAFTYASLHFLTYIVLDQFFDWTAISGDLTKRPFIMAGFTAFVVMVPLAVTSTAGWIRRLGGRAWQRLHRLTYVAAFAAVVHYWWLVKADITFPRRYAIAIGALLAFRAWHAIRRRQSPAPL
jgi:sulfoxide reductase heme-binding subunit YedZ